MKKSILCLLIAIVFVPFVATAEFGFKNTSTQETFASFASMDICESNRGNKIRETSGVVVFTECAEVTDVVNVDAKVDLSKIGDTYKPLAEIPGVTDEIQTSNVGSYLNAIIKIAIGLCGALAVIMIIISGIQYMGDESVFGKTEAKSKIFSAILGLLIALGAYALLNTINPDLTGQNGVTIDSAEITISSSDTSTGSSTSLCLPANPPNPDTATGSNITPNQEYLTAISKIDAPKGKKLLAIAQATFEGFYPGSKSYRTNNPGNIGNTDDGKTKTFATLEDGIKAQINNVVSGKGSYQIGGKSTCALGSETYDGSLYQYLRIYATGARTSNNYLNAIIGYFKSNGININGKTNMSTIYNMN